MYLKLTTCLLLLLFVACKTDTGVTTIPDVTPPDGPFAVDIGDSDLPYIVIDTKGTAIENEPKVAADMTIFVNKVELQKATIGIEFRGSTSFRISNKNRIEVQLIV